MISNAFTGNAGPAPTPAPTLCSACGGPAPELYFALTGDGLCRTCHYAREIQAQQARAQASLAAEAPPGFKPAGVRVESRASAIRNGFVLLAACVASTVVTAVALERIYLASGVLGLLALGAFARGLRLDNHQRKGRGWLAFGITASVVVLLALVAIVLVPE